MRITVRYLWICPLCSIWISVGFVSLQYRKFLRIPVCSGTQQGLRSNRCNGIYDSVFYTIGNFSHTNMWWYAARIAEQSLQRNLRFRFLSNRHDKLSGGHVKLYPVQIMIPGFFQPLISNRQRFNGKQIRARKGAFGKITDGNSVI